MQHGGDDRAIGNMEKYTRNKMFVFTETQVFARLTFYLL